MSLFNILRFPVLTSSFLFVFYASSPVAAQSEESIEAALRVNISGRQRMLSQRMTKAACFVQNNVSTALHDEMLRDAFALFSTSHDALRQGNSSVGLTREHSPRVLTAMELVDTRWQGFAPIVQRLIDTGDSSPADIAALDAAGLVLLNDMNAAVGRIAVTYGELLEDLPLIYSISIDAAGRQRMLSQKAAKEFCLIDSGIDVAKNQENLAYTVKIFTASLNALISGFPGMIVPAPNDEILAKLREVEAAWVIPGAVLQRAADGETITDADRQVVTTQIETVLVLMNQAVGMY